MKRTGAALCVLLLACASKAEREPEPIAVSKADVAPPEKPPEVPAVAPPAPGPPPFRGPMLTLRKPDTAHPGLIAPSRQGSAGELASLEAGEVLDVDFRCGARAQVSGPALVAVSARSDQGLLVRHGLVRVELPPGAAKPGTACWLATPALRMELPRAARFVLRAHEHGRTEIAVVSGRLTLATEAMPDVEDTGTQAIEAGRLVQADLTAGAAPRITTGPQTLEAAMTLLGIKSRASKPPVPHMLHDPIKGRLEGLVARAISEQSRARALDEQHRALVAAGDKQAMTLQRQIAEQAALTFRARRSVEAVLSRIEAASLTTAQAPAPDPLLARASELVR